MNSTCLSIIIPCYNSAAVLAKNLPYLLDNLKLSNISFEIILVNDGSKDEDEHDLKKLLVTVPGIYLSNEKNRGKGEALRKGFGAANGDIQVFTDPDIPYSFDSFRRIIDILGNGKADLVVGNRLDKRSVYYHKIGPLRRWGSRFVSIFLGILVTGGFYDTQCGIKGFTKKTAAKIFDWSRVDRFAIDIEVIYLALKFRYTIQKIPVELRSVDGNTVKVFRDGTRFLKDVFRIKRNYEKRRRKEQEQPAVG
ncbi:MAG: glycosyltransferase [Chitinophagaceae bacterium]